MRGLPFPSDALFNREQSYDFGSPGPNGTPALSDVAVPFDPTVGGVLSVSPAYFQGMNGVNGMEGHGVHQDSAAYSCSLAPTYAFNQYAQGPQGDPFAPQPPPQFFPDPNLHTPTDELAQTVSKPVKRKRRPRREEECGFCGGSDSKNRQQQPERMVVCNDCGRSGHPSCMELGDIGAILRNYQWKCIECKICEICQEKGDDERILFCDTCDRGWHMDCLDPPLEHNPEGSWFCPLCVPPLDASTPSIRQTEFQPLAEEPEQPGVEPEFQIDPALQMAVDINPTPREESIASSSYPAEKTRQSSRPTTKAASRKTAKFTKDRKGKGRAVMASGPEQFGDEEVEVEALGEGDDEEMYAPLPSTSKGKAPVNGRRKAKARSRRRSESVPDHVEPPSPPLRPQKRMRLTMRSLSPPPRQSQSGFSRPKVTVRLRLPPTRGKGKAREDDNDRSKKGMFDDILSVEDRDTSKTSVLNIDKDRFEKARVVAESKLVPPPAIESVDLLATPVPSTSRFPLRSAVHQLQQMQANLMSNTLPASPTPSTPGPSYFTKVDPSVLRIRTIRFGSFDIKTWYDAPFPEEFSNIPEGRLWICEFCLKYMKSRFGAQRHRLKCKCRQPPGDEIYRDGAISIFEVDGRKNKIYCQNLCLLSKMFLDHKSLFYDVEPFLFYVMTEVDDIGARFVGYFSKEKFSSKDLNLSCIMTLPVRQRQGWGNLLVDFSYLLSKKEHKSGTPERPLSALGALGYKKYWTLALMRYLRNAPDNPRLEDISTATAMSIEDIYLTLVQQDMITVHETPPSTVRPSPGRSIKINRSRKGGIARRNLQKAQPKDEDKAAKTEFVPPTVYDIHWSRERVRHILEDWESKGHLTLKPERLKWTPFLVSRTDTKFAAILENAATTSSIDVEATPVFASSVAPSASASGSATASVNVMDVADVVGASQPSPDAEPETPAGSSNLPEVDHVVVPELAIEREQSIATTEPDEPTPTPSPSPSPSPVPQLKPRSSINGLEALAAVAYAVSKANPVGLRRKSFNGPPLNGETFKPEWNHKALDLASPEPQQIVEFGSPRPSVHLRSRQSSEKGETHGFHVQTVEAANGRESVPRRLRSRLPSPPPVIIESRREPTPNPSLLSVLPESVDRDAELAAQLAREEGTRRRSLRSSSNSTTTTPILTTRNFRPKESSRKRGKASSVRESSPPTPLSPDRPITRRQAQAMAAESAKTSPGRATRQSSRLAANGGGNEGVVAPAAGVRTSSRLNGVTKPAAPPSPAKSARGQPSEVKARSTRAHPIQPSPEHSDEDDDGNATVEVDADAEGESDVDADGEPDVPSGEDVKVEGLSGHTGHVSNGLHTDMDTRSSTLSVKADPSDIYLPVHTREQALGMNGVSPVLMNMVDMPNNAKVFASGDTTQINTDADAEGEDVDAEGEIDEDADGEPDPDVYQ